MCVKSTELPCGFAALFAEKLCFAVATKKILEAMPPGGEAAKELVGSTEK